MTLGRIRCGVRIAAGVICVPATLYSVAAAVAARRDDVDLDGASVMRGILLAVFVAGVWVITEAIVGGFEQVQRTTRERYERLQAEAPTAYAIAAQAVCETYRKLQEQAAEESPKVRVMHR